MDLYYLSSAMQANECYLINFKFSPCIFKVSHFLLAD